MSDRARENVESKSRKAEASAKAPIQRETMGEVPALGAEPVGALLQRAQMAPGTISPNDGKRLQEALGNQSMANSGASAGSGAKSGNAGIGAIQAKLMVGAANDAFEQEADRIADRVMQQASAPAVDSGQAGGQAGGQATPTISRMTSSNAQRAGGEAGGAFEADAGLEADLQRTHGGGAPLPDEVRAKFEPAFGADFSGVRVHNTGDSARMSNAIQAKAFTHGGDIHFNQGEYDPGSSAGQRLLAHELTHVVQQGAATQGVQRKENGAADFAVQRTPFGTIQRTNKRVSSLIAFWEEQKKINAPQRVGTGGNAPQQPQEQQPQGQQPQGQQPQVSGAGGGSVFDNPSPVGGGSVFDNPSPGGGALHTPSGGGGGSVFNNPSPGFGGGGSGGGALHTPSGGGVLVTPNLVSHITFSSQFSSSSFFSSSEESLPVAGGPLPQAAQFPGQTKYKDRLKVDKTYKDEMFDSTIFVMTKVFGVSSAAEFFTKFTPEKRKEMLTKGIGWTETEVAELEATQKSKVKYVEDEAERAEYVLNLGPTITQGSSTVPYDTKDLFANGVGQGHAIFVMDPNGVFYAGRHKIGVFHHSSFLAGGDAASAGTLEISAGKLKGITAKSGHYQPKPRQLRLALAELESRGVSLAGVQSRTLDANTFKLDPPEDAKDFLDQGITPDVVPLSSSPQSASDSTTYTSSGLAMSTPIGGWAVGGSGTPAGTPQFDMSEEYLLNQAGGYDWPDKLKAMGLTGSGRNWYYKSYFIKHGDLLKILKGENKPDDFISG